jgi:release factor glutamine methyltransferase
MSEAFTEGPTVAEWLAAHRHLPRLELELLLCRHLAVPRAGLIAAPDQPLDGACLAPLTRDVQRLADGEPLAYITGERGFWDFVVEVTPSVLIPRPETETLVEQALARLAPGDRALDLGTGSGAIAIALARRGDVQVLAVDVSRQALAVAARNTARLAPSIELRESDWFAKVPERFQLITANPPYVAAGDPHLAALHYEPREALVSGPHGLDDLAIIIADAPTHLTVGGWLMVEHGYDQADPVAEGFQAAGFDAVSLITDLGGQPRVTMGRWTGGTPHG